jgi:hypothetical protein
MHKEAEEREQENQQVNGNQAANRSVSETSPLREFAKGALSMFHTKTSACEP